MNNDPKSVLPNPGCGRPLTCMTTHKIQMNGSLTHFCRFWWQTDGDLFIRIRRCMNNLPCFKQHLSPCFSLPLFFDNLWCCDFKRTHTACMSRTEGVTEVHYWIQLLSSSPKRTWMLLIDTYCLYHINIHAFNKQYPPSATNYVIVKLWKRPQNVFLSLLHKVSGFHKRHSSLGYVGTVIFLFFPFTTLLWNTQFLLVWYKIQREWRQTFQYWLLHDNKGHIYWVKKNIQYVAQLRQKYADCMCTIDQWSTGFVKVWL